MAFLPIPNPRLRNDSAIRSSILLAKRARDGLSTSFTPSNLPDKFDVAISFAGSERSFAEALAEKVRNAGFSVFYDNFYPEHLWGKNLTVFFDDIFRKKSRYCVMIVSKEYAARRWTVHEARSAQARAFQEKGGEYILPIKFDGTELDGLLPTIGYLGVDQGVEKISEMLISKLRS